MKLLGTFLDIIYLNIEPGSHSRQSRRILTRKKRLLIKENLDTDSADSDASIVLPDVKSQAFNKSILSHNKNWLRRMGNTYDKMSSYELW